MNHFCKHLFPILIFTAQICFSAPWFVSLSGNDATGTGTFDLPYLTISKAVTSAGAGDTIYVRGGIYPYTGSSTAITLPAKTGASVTSMCYLLSYPGERALLDFSAMTGTSADGLKINGSYWYIKGIDFKGAPHNGVKISGGNYNVVEFCSSFENRNTGIQLAAGASFNRFINCDSYNNRDSGDGNADGFSPKLDVGTNNYFYGCRSWQNSDDGWDGYLRPSDDVTDTLVNCWSFMNGYYKDGVTMGTGNGNGFKTGGCDVNASGYKTLKHNMTLIRCISFYNKAKGFDQNHNRGSVTMLNCTAFNNGNGSSTSGDKFNYAFSETLATSAGKELIAKNCISLGSTNGVQLSPSPTPVLVATNSWPEHATYPTNVTSATSADFISIDTTGVRGPRKADGSLPDIAFVHLVTGSQFIDAGIDVGFPFLGPAPDLGAFESSYPLPVELLSFIVLSEGSHALLQWMTVTEIDNYGFDIERRSVPYGQWQKIDFVEGRGTSNCPKSYVYDDKNIVSGRYAYRLKQIDNDGSFKYSYETEVLINTAPKKYSLSDGYPNPFNPATTIKFSVPEKSRVVLTIYNLLGQEVATLVDGTMEPGEYQKVFHAEHLASGIYLSVFDHGRDRLVKKLVLMK
jgi:hypothetical protein